MKEFLISFAMWILTSLIAALLTNDGITGIGIGTLVAIITYVFFEYCYKDIKKTAKRANA
ncbi:hypothetical protein AB6F13_01370 [Staphylococcus saprophyticus]|uniref:hypothetical protein n=1 Tax=Staphylococcus saprophyticus TaxID=29385 RepID=UPI002973B24A|nr:hypothetical protein [Staphylococcus saprophyticus]